MNPIGAERLQQVERAIEALRQDEQGFAVAQNKLMTDVDSLNNIGAALPKVPGPERMDYALKALSARASAYLPLVTNLNTQEAYATVVSIMFADIALSDYTGSEGRIEGLRPPPGHPELLPIERCVRDWIKASYGRVATGVPLAPTRRGYRLEVQAWMKSIGIESQKQAAKRLGVSIDVLKSIMSDKGERRYSKETLATVLGKIGLKPEGGE